MSVCVCACYGISIALYDTKVQMHGKLRWCGSGRGELVSGQG